MLLICLFFEGIIHINILVIFFDEFNQINTINVIIKNISGIIEL